MTSTAPRPNVIVNTPSPAMRFCKECNNLLYPSENRNERTLYYACKRCNYSEEPADKSGCVHQHALIRATELKLDIVHEDVVNDPTLQRSRNVDCMKCHHNEAVFFQADDSSQSLSLSLFFVCSSCGFKWVN